MTSYGSTRSTPPSVLALLPLLLFLLLLLLGAPHGAYSAADAPPHRVRLRDVHLGDGDALAFRLDLPAELFGLHHGRHADQFLLRHRLYGQQRAAVQPVLQRAPR